MSGKYYYIEFLPPLGTLTNKTDWYSQLYYSVPGPYTSFLQWRSAIRAYGGDVLRFESPDVPDEGSESYETDIDGEKHDKPEYNFVPPEDVDESNVTVTINYLLDGEPKFAVFHGSARFPRIWGKVPVKVVNRHSLSNGAAVSGAELDLFEALRGMHVGIDGIKFTSSGNTITKSDIAGNVYWQASIAEISNITGSVMHVPNPGGDAGCCFYGEAVNTPSALVGYLNGAGELEWIYDLYHIVPYPYIDYSQGNRKYHAVLLGADKTGKIYIGLRCLNSSTGKKSIDLWSPPDIALTNVYSGSSGDGLMNIRRGGVSRSGKITYVVSEHLQYDFEEIHGTSGIITVSKEGGWDGVYGVTSNVDEKGRTYYIKPEISSSEMF